MSLSVSTKTYRKVIFCSSHHSECNAVSPEANDGVAPPIPYHSEMCPSQMSQTKCKRTFKGKCSSHVAKVVSSHKWLLGYVSWYIWQKATSILQRWGKMSIGKKKNNSGNREWMVESSMISFVSGRNGSRCSKLNRSCFLLIHATSIDQCGFGKLVNFVCTCVCVILSIPKPSLIRKPFHSSRESYGWTS